jgi:predicted Rossmann fold nucleotide-binding protein DprA/Smf involved in DNA uptake
MLDTREGTVVLYHPMFTPVHIVQSDLLYPSVFRTYLGDRAPATITARGNLNILPGQSSAPLVALFCSVQCSGSIILQTYALAYALRDAGAAVISGFHSPMEKECLNVLLDGSQPVVICPARGIERLRLPAAWKAALKQERLLLLSPFAENQRRATTGRAQIRNEFVAALADAVLVAHAVPGGKTERFCREVRAWGKPLLALENAENADLLALGATPLHPEALTPLHILPGIS